MTEEEMKMLQGVFQGANLNNVQINMIVQSGAKVVYKEVTSAKEEKPQVTDLQIANAIRAINGKGKPLSGYQLWLGVCCLLSWKYDYPRNQLCYLLRESGLGVLLGNGHGEGEPRFPLHLQ